MTTETYNFINLIFVWPWFIYSWIIGHYHSQLCEYKFPWSRFNRTKNCTCSCHYLGRVRLSTWMSFWHTLRDRLSFSSFWHLTLKSIFSNHQSQLQFGDLIYVEYLSFGPREICDLSHINSFELSVHAFIHFGFECFLLNIENNI